MLSYECCTKLESLRALLIWPLLFTVPRRPLPNEDVNVYVDKAVGLVTGASAEIFEKEAGIGTGIGGYFVSSCDLLAVVWLMDVEDAFLSDENVPGIYNLGKCIYTEK